ncbi:uncharacterized protein LOC142336914 [Convolutriloba macropyga]|uniref:uncharacterized protein LOC142336914 n=1 Tax=Convolutriloba macropyga TaxID=536237 RepID=UPI003F51BA62
MSRRFLPNSNSNPNPNQRALSLAQNKDPQTTAERERLESLLKKLDNQIEKSQEIRRESGELLQDLGLAASIHGQISSHFTRQPAHENFRGQKDVAQYSKVVHSQPTWNQDRQRRLNEGINILTSAYNQRQSNTQYLSNLH